MRTKNRIYVDGANHPQAVKIREAARPAPVFHSRTPDWVYERMRAAIADGRLEAPDRTSDDSWDGRANKTKAKLVRKYELDRVISSYCQGQHAGLSFEEDGQESFVWEPYTGDSPTIIPLAREFAKLLDCDISINANSWWHPLRTIRITFSEPLSESDRDATFEARLLIFELRARGISIKKHYGEIHVRPEEKLLVRERRAITKYRKQILAQLHAQQVLERELKRSRQMMEPAEV